MNATIKKTNSPASYLKVENFEVTQVQATTGLAVVHYQECLRRKDSVAVLLHRTVDNHFVWVKQFRIGPALKEAGRTSTLEPVAGMIDDNETPLQAVQREVLEETHLKTITCEPLFSFYMCPGISEERMHLFYATIEAPIIDSVGGLIEENEVIEISPLSQEQTQRKIDNGEIDTAHAILLWQWAKIKGLAS